ncbi:hypothetical protein [Armatimonas sp.]|uniref:hypothetical protein n=1 Tax=Armatimonas sp. TaxID=1872638 RepID=UPI0037507BE2
MQAPLPPTLPLLGIAGIALLAGCSPPRSAPPPLPLPPLPETGAAQLALLLEEAQRRVEKDGRPAPYFWRRLAWIQHHQGNHDLALKTLDKAMISLQNSDFPTNQESLERTAVAEQYLAMNAPQKAREALGEFRYQGSSPQAQQLLARITLTPLEIQRLESPDIFLAPRLVVSLWDKGPRRALQKALESRLEFALMRGPEGGRSESYHGAIVLQFHFGDPLISIRATDQESPTDKVRTLACLYWGGTTVPSTILISGESFTASRKALPPAVSQELRERFLAALRALSPLKSFDVELTAILILACQSGDRELVQEAARPLADALYQSQVQKAILSQQPIPLPALSNAPRTSVYISIPIRPSAVRGGHAGGSPRQPRSLFPPRV